MGRAKVPGETFCSKIPRAASVICVTVKDAAVNLASLGGIDTLNGSEHR
jgi:hypothetical protein